MPRDNRISNWVQQAASVIRYSFHGFFTTVSRAVSRYMDTAMLGLVSVSLSVCTEVRGVERRSARRSSLKGRQRAIVSQTNTGTF